MANNKPLSVAEREYVSNHPEMSLTDLAVRLDRDEKTLPELLAQAVQQGMRFGAVAKMTVKRDGKRVAAIMTPQASAAMDDVRKNSTRPAPPPAHPVKDGKASECIFKPLGNV